MQLDSPLRITEKVQTACLPPDDMIKTDGDCPGCNGLGIFDGHGQFLSCYYTGWKVINKTDNILR